MDNRGRLQSYEERLRAALDKIVMDSWRPMSGWIAVVFVGMTFNHLSMSDVVARPWVTGFSAGTAVLFFLLFLILWRRPLPVHWAHPLGAAMAMVILFNSLLHLSLTNDVLQTTNVILLLIGAGFMFLSLPWFLGVAVVSLVGWLWVEQQAPHVFSWDHFAIALVLTVALAVFIQDARLRSVRRLEGLRLQLETSIGVSQRITSILELDVLLNQVTELIKEKYGYYFVGIFLLDESQQNVVLRAGTGEMGRKLFDEGFRLRVGKDGLIGWAVSRREVVRVNDVVGDGRYMKSETVPLTRAELVIPLQVGTTLLGALDIQSERTQAFNQDDLTVFQGLSDQVSIAIQNALLYEKEQSRRRLAETLYEVGQALSQTLDLQEVLDLILEHLSSIVPYDRASVMLRNEDALEIAAARGFPLAAQPSQIRVSIKADDVYDQVCRMQQPLTIPDVLERPDWQHVAGLPQARSWLGAPLIRSGQVIGMFSLTREAPNPYTSDDAALATAFAGQAAIVLENARLYANVTRAYEQLGRLDRTKSDFINIASHELRTPLTLLRGYSQILLRDPAIVGNPTLYQMMEGIMLGTSRLHEIIDSMLDVAKIDSGALELHREPLSLHKLMESVAGTFKRDLSERQIQLEIDALQNLPDIEADTAALRKVFTNLIVNAIKYTPDGGRITLCGRVLPRNRTDLPEGGVEIQVQDTGIGIDPQFHDLIFTKFYQTGEVALHSTGRTKFKGGGPGLGLAIAKGIVEAHGGRVWVESAGYDEEACPGSTFFVMLPLRKG